MGVGKRFLAVLLVAAILAGAWAAYSRFLQENNNRRVELALDARLLEGADWSGGKSPDEWPAELKEAGCTAVAVTPLSLNDLEKRGEIVALTPSLFIITGAEDLGAKLCAALSPLLEGVECKNIRVRSRPLGGTIEEPAPKDAGVEKLAGGGFQGSAPQQRPGGDFFAENGDSAATYESLSIPGRYVPAVKDLPLLWPGEQMLAWQQAGLHIVPLFNYPARLSSLQSEKYWEVLARQLQEIEQADEIRFGPAVFPAASFNYPAPQGAAGQIFQEEGLSLGVVEFTQGQGLQALAAALDYRLCRTHQISGAELAQLGETRARERFLRAVQERKVRLLLLQPFPEIDPRNEWANYRPLVLNLNKDLQAAGFSPGEASPFLPFNIPGAVQALFGAGVAAATVLVAGFIPGRKVNRSEKRLLFLAGAAFILVAAGFFLAGERLPFYTLGRQLAALAASLVFPLLSVMLFLDTALSPSIPAGQNIHTMQPDLTDGGKTARRNKRRRGKKGALGKLVWGFLLASLLTAGGALIAAGLLGDISFLLKVESFRGVKIAQAGPFLLYGFLLLWQNSRGLLQAGRDFLETRLRAKHLVVLALAGGILLIYLIRGGNAPLLPVSTWELALRHKLEVLFVARPRFKEFLIGHPGFFLFGALAAGHWRGAKIPALLLGLLGQVSLFNTFMHLHRPIALSVLGTVYGIVLGLLGGLLLYFLTGAVARRRLTPPGKQ